MPKEETFEVTGVVLEGKPNEQFLVAVKLTGKEANDKEINILATLASNIRKFRIRITKGDLVTVCMSHYDLKRGRITYRNKK